MQARGEGTRNDVERELVRLVMESRTFARAPRLRELFHYIADRSDASEWEALSEQQIGARVFGRAEAYNPGEDNIVRASVRQLRSKLKEYFESEGRDRETVVEIPKGSYRLVFIPRSITAHLPPPPQGKKAMQIAVALLALLALILAAIVVRRGTASVSPPSALTELFPPNSQERILFVLTDAALMLVRPSLVAPPSPQEYASATFWESIDKSLASSASGKFERDLQGRRITSIADVMILTKLLQRHPDLGRRIEVRHARDLSARDLSGRALVITGGEQSNPWAALFEPHMNFRLQEGHVINRSPESGEPGNYGPSTKERQWARIFFGRNIEGVPLLLLIAGLDYQGTEGAGEFLLKPTASSEIRVALHIGERQPLPSFELLLEAGSLAGTARSTRIVGARAY